MAEKLTQTVYSNGQLRLTAYPRFLYEVSLYKVWKDRAECAGSQFYVSDEPLVINKETICKKVEDYRLYKFTTCVAAPLDYMLSNGFTLYNESNTKRRKPSSSKRKAV